MSKIFVEAGTVEHKVAMGTLTFVGTDYDKDIFSDLGDDKMMRLYETRLAEAQYQAQFSDN